MDSRRMESGLALTATGLGVFLLLGFFSILLSSASLYQVSVIVMAAFFVTGLTIATSGLVRKSTMQSLHDKRLLVESFILGVVLLWIEWVALLQYSRIIGSLDCYPYICESILGISQSFIVPVFLAIGVATPAVLFLSLLTAAPHSTGHARTL